MIRENHIVAYERPLSSLVFLDGLRGLAAFYVMVGHARGFLWEGYSEGYKKHPEIYSIAEKVSMYFFALFKFGHEVVLFFFVLSGFVIHLKYARRYMNNPSARFHWVDYILRRAKRIYPPFLFSICLTYVLDIIGIGNGYALYTGDIKLNVFDITFYHDFRTLVGNILFLYQEYVPLFGSNGPAWSLKYEWWFYMLYPFLLLASKKSILVSTAILLILFISTFIKGIWPVELLRDVITLMLSWWFGVLLAEVYVGRLKISFGKVSLLICIIPFCPFLSSVNDIIYFTGIALGVTGFLSILFLLQEKKMELRFIESLRFLGDISYTLYIIHFPILMWLSGWWMDHHYNSLPRGGELILSGIAIVMFVSYFVHFITEVPFTRKKLKPLIRTEYDR